MKKRIIAVILCITMICLSACGSNAKDPSVSSESQNTVDAKEETNDSSDQVIKGNTLWEESEPGYYIVNGVDIGRFPFPEFAEIASKYGGYTDEDYVCIKSDGSVRVGNDADWLKKNYTYNLVRKAENEYRLDITVKKDENLKLSEIVTSESDFFNSLSFMMSDETKSDYATFIDTLKSTDDVDFYAEGPFEGADPVIDLVWDCFGSNPFIKLTFTLDYAGEAASGPWKVNEDGHVIADNIDLYYFPMDKLYETAENIGEISYGNHRDGWFSFQFSDGDLWYMCYVQSTDDGFVDFDIVAEDVFSVANKNGGDIHAIMDVYDTLFDVIAPSVLNKEQKAVFKTSWEEIKNSDDLESMPSIGFALSEKEWWNLTIGSTFRMHLDCSNMQQ
jgi:hypothetical protein